MPCTYELGLSDPSLTPGAAVALEVLMKAAMTVPGGCELGPATPAPATEAAVGLVERLAPARSWGRPLRISGVPGAATWLSWKLAFRGKEACKVKVSLKVEAGGTLWRTSWVEAVVLTGGPLVSTVVRGIVCRVKAEADPTGATPRWMLPGTEEALRRNRKQIWLRQEVPPNWLERRAQEERSQKCFVFVSVNID